MAKKVKKMDSKSIIEMVDALEMECSSHRSCLDCPFYSKENSVCALRIGTPVAMKFSSWYDRLKSEKEEER